MYKSLVRGVLAIASVSAAFAPTTSEACWLTHCFSCCKPKPAPTYCPPPAPACDVCPQQVNYVPQTCYRAVETCVPTTTCRPETICDPCTGPQTVMRPVTTYARKQVMVPYTTYRPVVTPVAAAPCSTCTGAAYNSPYYNGAQMQMPAVAPAMATAPAGCANCASGYATQAAGQPMYQSAPMNGGMTITSPPALAPTQQVPTPAAPQSAPSGLEGGQTFGPTNTTPPPANTPQAAYQSIPDAGRMQTAPPFNGGTPNAPALLPASPDRTTARPMYRAASILPAIFGGGPAKNNVVKTASATRVVEPAPQSASDGWRPMGGR